MKRHGQPPGTAVDVIDFNTVGTGTCQQPATWARRLHPVVVTLHGKISAGCKGRDEHQPQVAVREQALAAQGEYGYGIATVERYSLLVNRDHAQAAGIVLLGNSCLY